MGTKGNAILEGLNSEQVAAVSCVDGPVLIVAGAGSGKTRVLTSRIAYILAERECDPARILALTFTKKAASEMKERIAVMVGERRARRLYMGTFHSVFIRFLREYAESLGYPKTFTIYDTSDSVSAIKACIKELQLDEKVYKPKDVLSRISMAKNSLVTPGAYMRNTAAQQNDAAAKKPRIVDIYALYAQKCRLSGVMDFDDILLNMNILLRDNREAYESISGRFDYIMVDEYQDTNFAQYLILKKLSEKSGNICVVGDDSQSIYAFRGAKIENILNFKKDYPHHHIFRLEQNYRSTQVIVNAANSLIAKNSARIPKECYSRGDVGDKIRFLKAYTETEEVDLVAASIKSQIYASHAQYSEFAVLYRTLSQGRIFEQGLRKHNIPCQVMAGPPFLERLEVKDVLYFLKLFANKCDDEAFKRAILLIPGIGNTTLQALMSVADQLNLCLYDALNNSSLESYGIKSSTLTKLLKFRDEINEFFGYSSTMDCHKFAIEVVSKYQLLSKYKSESDDESKARAENVEELMNWIGIVSEQIKCNRLEELYASLGDGSDIEISLDQVPPVTIGDFLEEAALLSSNDTEEDDNKVLLMTIHASKGLEFPYVYVAGLEENLFPSGGWMATESEVEEERRLFYVAMTRAKKNLSISFAASRFRNGKRDSNSPSRFLYEIDPSYVANPLTKERETGEVRRQSFGQWKKDGGPSRPTVNTYGQSSRPEIVRRPQQPLQRKPEPTPTPVRRPQTVPVRVSDADFEPTPILDLRAGQRIEHNRFGFGRIVEITGNPADLKAKIAFDDHGEKILILKYAKIRVVNIGQ